MEPRERLAVVVRRWPLVVGAVVVGLVLAVVVAVLTPATYQAQTRLFVSAGADTPGSDGLPTLGRNLAGSRLRSYPGLVSSPAVLGFSGSPDDLARRVQATVPLGTQLIDIRVTGRSASDAAGLANAVGDRLGRAIEGLETPQGTTTPLVLVRAVTPASPPSDPMWPSVPVLLAGGLIAGLFAGAGAALLAERRRTVSARARAGAQVTQGVPR